jgi:hypothetical protein
MKKQIVSMFLCLSVGLGVAQAQLMIDFGQTGGTAAVEPGYQGYFATDKNAASFTAQSYTAFGTTVTVKAGFAPGAAAAGMRAIDRGTDDGITDHVNLLRDWIGFDTRQTGDPMTLTISGLPAGTYQWLSYHHDAHDQTGIFSVTVKDAGGSATTTGIDISNTTGSTVRTLADATKFSTVITANGKDDVSLVFHQTSPSNPVATAISVINGFELASIDTGTALAPVPPNQATDVPRDGTVLSWIATTNAVSHDVYLGVDFDDIDDGTTASAVYKGRQSANSFNPGRLELGQTYYWRVDEVTSGGAISKGNIWSFTVEPLSVVLAASHIKATASSSNSTNEGPEKTIGGLGLDASDRHSTNTDEMWLSARSEPGTAWIQYEFDKLYELHQMLVWNHNSSVESVAGFGAKDVTVAYSRDGVEWVVRETSSEFAQASGTSDYVANTTFDFDRAVAKYVKISIATNWGGIIPQYGLSEVRFMVIPVMAREPRPASGATGVDPRVPLSWRAGREADSHKVYVGSDANAVSNGEAAASIVSEPSFDAGALLQLGKTYYWKVDEVNYRETLFTWPGDVWSFTVASTLVIEDFESYTNDSPKRVFQTWIDGLGFSEDQFFPKGNPGNGSGALVGYDPTLGNIMELVSYHGGVQSMPVAYDSSSVAYSEAERTFDAPQDWTLYNVKALTLWFCGNPTNTASTMYVKVNGKKVVYGGDGDDLLSKPWHLWYVPLSDFTGVDLKKVTKLAIGFEGGTGLVFFDDITLSPLDRQLVTPVKPAATNLLASYAFEGNANSSTGKLAGATAGSATFAAGKVGQALKLNGASDYVLVEGSLNLPEYSAALWFKVEGGTGNRALLSIFNDAALHGALLEVTSTGGLRFLHRAPVGVATGDVNIRNNGKFDDGVWYHVAAVKSADTATLYINGEQAGSAASTTPFDQALTKMAVGMLKYPIDAADPRYFPGQIDEVYLYGRALSPAEVASLAGRTKPFDQ